MKTKDTLIEQAYDLGFKASKYIHFLKGVLLGIAIAIGIINAFG